MFALKKILKRIASYYGFWLSAKLGKSSEETVDFFIIPVILYQIRNIIEKFFSPDVSYQKIIMMASDLRKAK